jgi:mucin-19
MENMIKSLSENSDPMGGAEVTRLRMLWKTPDLAVDEVSLLTSAPTFQTRSKTVQKVWGWSVPFAGVAGVRIAPVLLLAVVLGMVWSVQAANPVGEQVLSGEVSFDRSTPNVLTIGQTTDRAIINWRDFSIGSGDVTRFVQPGAGSATLNRVVGGDPSTIYGQLQANGRIFLINPAGVLVGEGGRVDTGGLVASTLDLSNESFLEGAQIRFSGDSQASVRNHGRIGVSRGDVYLIARIVENTGSIRASSGTVGLGGGGEVVLIDGGGIGVLAGNGSVANSGSVDAASAELKAVNGNIYALAINNTGVVRAGRLANQGGRIVLLAEGTTAISSGSLIAPGGEVQLLGEQVGLDGSIDVSGESEGGTALVGGGFQGAAPGVLNAVRTVVGAGARINANAGLNGDGGSVVVWSDRLTSYGGAITAAGGAESGRGGQVEVSGRENLAFTGSVDVHAPKGPSGSVLLDPRDLSIVVSAANDSLLTSTGLLSSAPDTITDASLSAGAIAALTGNISIQASRNLSIQTGLDLVNQTQGETVSFTAGGNLTIGGLVKTAGANLAFTASSGGVDSTSAKLSIEGPVVGGDVTFANPGGSGGILLAATLPNPGKAVTFKDKVAVTSNVRVVGGDITFEDTLNGDVSANNRRLTLETTGVVAFNKAVGNTGQFDELFVRGSGNTLIKGGSIRATSQRFLNEVVLGTSTTLTGVNVEFAGPVGAAVATAPSLTVNASGNTVFGGAVGKSGGTLTSVTTDAAGATSLKGGSIAATTQAFNDPVTLSANTTITGQTVTFGKTLNADLEASGRELTLVVGGVTSFKGAVGLGRDGVLGTSDDGGLLSLSTAAGGSTLISGGTVKAGVQTYGDPVSLGANTTLSGATFRFDDTLNASGGAPTLTLGNTGTATFNGAVGNSTLGALITGSTGSTVIRTASIQATTQTYNNPVLIGNDTRLTGTRVTFNSTIDGASASEQESLTINANSTVLNASAEVGRTRALKAFTTDASGSTTLANGQLTAATIRIDDKLILAANTTLTGSTISLKAVEGDSTANNRTLTLNANLTTTLGGKIGESGVLAGLTTNPGGETRLSAGSIAATDQWYRDHVKVAGATTLNADANGAGTVRFSQGIDGANASSGVMVVNATTSWFGGPIGATARLGSLTTDSAGTSTFGSTVAATTLTFNDPVRVSGNSTFTGLTVKFNSTLDADAVANNRTITVNASGDTLFAASVGSLARPLSLETDTAGAVRFGVGGTLAPGVQILTTGPQTFRDVVRLQADSPGVLIDASSIEFQKTVDADSLSKNRALTLNSPGETRFGGALGSIAPLSAVTTDAAGTTRLDGGSIKATAIRFDDNVLLTKNTTLTATGGSVYFSGTVDGDTAGARSLTVNSTTTTFTRPVGTVASLSGLTTDLIGTTTISGSEVHAVNQSFSDAVVFTSDSTLTGTTVALNGTVDGNLAAARSLVVNADGSTTFGGVVGGTASLALLKTDTAGSSLLKGPEINAAVQEFGDDVTLYSDAVLQGAVGGAQASAVTFGGAVNGNVANGRSITVKSSGTTTFQGAVGSVGKLLNLTTDAGGGTLIQSASVAASTQSYNDPVTLGNTATLTGTTITFGSSLDADSVAGARALTINAGGAATFASTVGGIVPLSALTTDAAGTTAINGGVLSATSQTFGDAVILGGNTILNGSTIAFSGTLNGATAGGMALTANASQGLSFSGAVGGTASLASLTAGGSGATTIGTGSVITQGAQTYNGAVVLSSNSTLSGGGITFGGILDADQPSNNRVLTVASGGLKSFSGKVGSKAAFAVLNATGGGGVAISGGSVNTTTQDYTSETVTLGTDTLFGGTTLSFGTINGNSRNLTLSATGTTTLSGVVSGVVDLVSDKGGTTVLSSSVSTTGSQVFSDAALVLASDVTLTSTGSGSAGNISLNSPVDGAHSLRLISGGTAVLAGTIGSTTPLVGLTSDNNASTQTVIDAGSVTTTGSQVYAGNLGLASDTVFTASTVSFPATPANSNARGNNVTLALSGAIDLGADFFNGTIGALSVGAPGGIAVSGTLAVGGSQTFSHALTLGADVTLSGADLTLAAVNGGGHNLTLAQRGVGFLGGAVNNLAALQTGVSGLTILGADLSVTSINLQNPVLLSGHRTLTTTGTMNLNAVIGNGKNLTLNGSGGITLAGRLQGLATVDVTGATTLTGGDGGGGLSTISTSGSQAFHSALTLGSGTLLEGAGITLGAVTGGGYNLTVRDTGTTTFGGAVSGVADLLSDAGGTSVVGGTITTTGSQTYSDVLQLTANSVLTGSSLTLASVTGGGFDLTVTGSGAGVSTLGGGVSNLGNLAVTAGSGGIVLGGGTVTTTATQTYHSPVRLSVDTVLSGTTITTAGSATVNGTGDGTESLGVTGNAVFGAAAGTTAGKALKSLSVSGTTDLAGDVTTSTAGGGTGAQIYTGNVVLAAATTLTGSTVLFGADNTMDKVDGNGQNLVLDFSGSTVLAGGFGQRAGNQIASLTLGNGGSTTLLGNVVTTGPQSYSDSLVLAAASTLNSGSGNLSVSAVAGAGFDMTLTSTGAKALTGAISDVANWVVTAGGTGTTITGGSIATTGAQTYGDTVTLGAATVLVGTDLTLAGITGDGFNLDLSGTGTTSFTGTVSGVGVLTSGNGGTTTIGATIGSTGSQTFSEPVTLTADTTLNAGSADISFVETITGGGFALNIITTGNGNLMKSATGMSTLTTSAGGKTIFGSSGGSAVSITTTGAQVYDDEVDTWVHATLTGSSVSLNGGVSDPRAGGNASTSITTIP